jgi:hypothetical protein
MVALKNPLKNLGLVRLGKCEELQSHLYAAPLRTRIHSAEFQGRFLALPAIFMNEPT